MAAEDIAAEGLPRAHRFVELYHRLYVLEPTGGPLHVVLDDGNIEDADLADPDYGYLDTEPYDIRHPDEDRQFIREACSELLEILRSWTEAQRVTVLERARAIHHAALVDDSFFRPVVDTDNDFAIGASPALLCPALPIVIRTRQQAYRTAAWIKLMGEVLPDEDPASEYDEVEHAIRST